MIFNKIMTGFVESLEGVGGFKYGLEPGLRHSEEHTVHRLWQ